MSLKREQLILCRRELVKILDFLNTLRDYGFGSFDFYYNDGGECGLSSYMSRRQFDRQIFKELVDDFKNEMADYFDVELYVRTTDDDERGLGEVYVIIGLD